jgi:hypothetical protein
MVWRLERAVALDAPDPVDVDEARDERTTEALDRPTIGVLAQVANHVGDEQDPHPRLPNLKSGLYFSAHVVISGKGSAEHGSIGAVQGAHPQVDACWIAGRVVVIHSVRTS